MIRLSLRLLFRGGREAATRLAFIGAGVALGVVMLAFAVAGINGLHAQDARFGWLTTSAHNRRPSALDTVSDPLLWRRTHDEFRGHPIERIDLAATGAHGPVPPGLVALPAPGQFAASPALTRLLSGTPRPELANRFPGRQVGSVARAGLTSPNTLVIVVGHRTSELAGRAGVVEVRSIETLPRQHSYSTFQEVALGVGAAAVLVPILVFIGMATRIGASRRERRLAAMRLVGATPRQVAVLAATEAVVATFVGVVGGISVFWLARPLLASIPLTGDAWFTTDLSLGPLATTLMLVGLPAGAAIAGMGALGRVRISPLGVTRRASPPPPTPARLVPLGLGVLILGTFALAGRPYNRGASGTYAPTIVIGFVLMMAGLVAAGPWLVMSSSRLLNNRAGHPSVLIASRRLTDDPAAAFRSVSGLILALFVGSVLVGATETATAASSQGGAGSDRTAITTSIAEPVTPRTARRVAARLHSQSGVRAITAVYADPSGNVNGFPSGLVRCTDLATTPAIGRCPSAGHVAVMPLYALETGHTEPSTTWHAASVALSRLTAIPVRALIIATDGSVAALERVRTTVQISAPSEMSVAQTVGQLSAANRRDVTEVRHLADIVIFISILVAGASLAVAVAGGLIERRRPFTLLRLTGVPLKVLRRIVILEAAIPLIGLAVLSCAAGLGTAALLLRAVRGSGLHPPGTDYYLMTLLALVTALGVVTGTMPLLRRITNPESARRE